MPFRRRTFAPCVARSSSKNISSVPAGVASVRVARKKRRGASCGVGWGCGLLWAWGRGLGGEPLPDVRNFLIRIIKPAAEKAIRHGLALGCIEGRRRGIECPQASRNPLALHGVNEIAFCQHNSVGDGGLFYRFD